MRIHFEYTCANAKVLKSNKEKKRKSISMPIRGLKATRKRKKKKKLLDTNTFMCHHDEPNDCKKET